MPKIISNNISLYYQTKGKGYPIVLISGLHGDHQSVWSHSVVDTLAKHFHVIQFDNRGVGQSDQPDIPYSIEMMADDVAGHLLSLEYPNKFAQVICDFLVEKGVEKTNK